MGEIALGSARGGKRPELPITWRVLRPLEPADLPAIQHPPPVGAVPRVRALRSAHHQLAQLLANGEEQETICLMTGYSMSHLSALKTDPTFIELVKYYSIQREQIFIDLVEREKALGISTLEELQSRLEDEPESWTKKELMELYDRLRPPQQAGKGGPAGSPQAPSPVAIQVNFVSPGKRTELNNAQVIDARVLSEL